MKQNVNLLEGSIVAALTKLAHQSSRALYYQFGFYNTEELPQKNLPNSNC